MLRLRWNRSFGKGLSLVNLPSLCISSYVGLVWDKIYKVPLLVLITHERSKKLLVYHSQLERRAVLPLFE